MNVLENVIIVIIVTLFVSLIRESCYKKQQKECFMLGVKENYAQREDSKICIGKTCIYEKNLAALKTIMRTPTSDGNGTGDTLFTTNLKQVGNLKIDTGIIVAGHITNTGELVNHGLIRSKDLGFVDKLGHLEELETGGWYHWVDGIQHEGRTMETD
jgi:hypothetical protein